MVLTQANVQTRLAAIVADPATPIPISRWLNVLLDQQRSLGRDPAAVDARVDQYLDTAPAALNEETLRRALAWVLDRWSVLPRS